jgi:hypothetical protein
MGTPTEGQSPHGAALLPVPACPISPNAASEHLRCFVAAPLPGNGRIIEVSPRFGPQKRVSSSGVDAGGLQAGCNRRAAR